MRFTNNLDIALVGPGLQAPMDTSQYHEDFNQSGKPSFEIMLVVLMLMPILLAKIAYHENSGEAESIGCTSHLWPWSDWFQIVTHTIPHTSSHTFHTSSHTLYLCTHQAWLSWILVWLQWPLYFRDILCYSMQLCHLLYLQEASKSLVHFELAHHKFVCIQVYGWIHTHIHTPGCWEYSSAMMILETSFINVQSF